MLRLPVASIATRWLLIGLALLCAVGLLALVFIVALDKEVDAWSRIALFAIAISACVATFLVSPPEWDSRQPLASILKPRFLAVIIAALFVSFEMTSNAVGMFAPRDVVESAPLAIENTVRDNNRMLSKLSGGEKSAVLSDIVGRWGEDATCAVAYAVAVDDGAVIVERESADLPAFRMVGQIKSAEANRVSLATLLPERARGDALDLVVERAGPVEWLVWDEVGTDVPLKLRRCDGV